MLRIAIVVNAFSTFPSNKGAAPLVLPPPPGALLPVDPEPPELAGALGVKTAPGLLMQELAAAFAADAEVGARGLTVPLPAKLHD